MAAVQTQKPGFARALQMTFPSEFSAAYKAEGKKPSYYGGEISLMKQYPGDDAYALEHVQRRKAAHATALERVQATQATRRMAEVSECGYFGMPKPVLSQRKIGSNFGVGGGANMGYQPFGGFAHLEGGVLASREGREYAKRVLQKRSAELDAIAQSSLEGPTMQARVDQAQMNFAEQSKIEIATIFSQVAANIYSAPDKIDAISFETLRRLILLVIRYATSPNSDATLGSDLQEYLAETDRLIELLESALSYAAPEAELIEQQREQVRRLMGPAFLGAAPSEARPSKKLNQDYIILLKDLLMKFRAYLAKMFENVNLDAAGRKLLSQSLVKSVGFSNLGTGDTKKLIRSIATAGDLPEWADATSNAKWMKEAQSVEKTSGPRWAPRESLEDSNMDAFGRMAYAREAGKERRYWGEGGGGEGLMAAAAAETEQLAPFMSGISPEEELMAAASAVRGSTRVSAREAARRANLEALGMPEPPAAAAAAARPGSSALERLRMQEQGAAPAAGAELPPSSAASVTSTEATGAQEMAPLFDRILAVGEAEGISEAILNRYIDYVARVSPQRTIAYWNSTADPSFADMYTQVIAPIQGGNIAELREFYKALTGARTYPRGAKMGDLKEAIKRAFGIE